MINFTVLLLANLPGTQWSISADDTDPLLYDSLVFHDGTPKPSLEQFQAWQIELDAVIAATQYQRDRKAEYPPTEDLLVALWELVVERRSDLADDLQARRVAIKNKYPKK